MAQQRALTGARPTGGLHLGHFAAILRPMLDAAERGHEVVFVIADLHALTTHADRARATRIGEAGLVLAAQVLASGVDPDAVRLVRQSAVPELSQAYAIVQSLAPSAPLAGMASYQVMSAGLDAPSLGLLGYPVMEAADALALEAEVVLVGEHNVAHVETARAIVGRIRDTTGVELLMPRAVVGSGNLVGLDGVQKMSKSLGNDVGLLLDRDAVIDRLRGSALLAAGPERRARLVAALGVEDDARPEVVAARVGDWVDAYRLRTDALLAERGALAERIAHDSRRARERVARSTERLLGALGLGAVA